MPRKAVALRHVSFEGLGTFEQELMSDGYDIRYVDVGLGKLTEVDAFDSDLLIVLGGPIGVYQTEAYPFLIDEIALIEARLAAGKPLLGVCLGAQLIAAVLGARIRPTGAKEIGFSTLTLTEAGAASPLCQLADVPVLHWHGDVFDLPKGTDLLATTSFSNQAFAVGSNVLAMQFHAEADCENGIEPWLIGHSAELAGARIDPRDIRCLARQHGARLRKAGRAMLADWLGEIGKSPNAA